MGFIDLARKGYKATGSIPSLSKGTGYATGYWTGQTSDGFDWNREAGLRYDNSIVFSAIMYACNAMSEVDMYVRRKESVDGTYKEIPGHPITELLKNPNPWYDGETMMSGWIISELAGRGGTSYTYKHRSPAGKVVALEYLPHFSVRPYSTPGIGSFIDLFYVTVEGGMLEISPSNIIQQRFGPINPMRPQLAIGPLEAVLMEIGTDRQCANYTAALLKNVGVTPHMISPAVSTSDLDITFGQEQAQQILNTFQERITGSNRGLPMVVPIPIKVESLSFSPGDMNLDAVRNLSEERICAVLRIPPLILNLGTGLEHTNNRASSEAAASQAARDFVVPYMRKKAKQLTRDLVPELGLPGDEVCFRMDKIAALMENATEKAKQNAIACGGPWLTVNQVRFNEDLPPIEGGDELRNSGEGSNVPQSRTEPYKQEKTPTKTQPEDEAANPK